MTTYPLEIPVFRVEQPLGTFYLGVLSARTLLEVAYSDVMSATLNENGVGYTLTGTQRSSRSQRIPHIAAYIDRVDSTFPNSIILAANYQEESGLAVDDEELASTNSQGTSHQWFISESADGLKLVIPSRDKVAAIIDGQHRLFAFAKATKEERLDMPLVCSIFLDLPKPYQAQIFATINSNQKPVDKSLTYEQFGYNISEESVEYWTPDKLAVFLTRKLATEDESPLKGRIIVAPKRDAALLALNEGASWKVSTAVIVEGILRLISSNPKSDSNEMLNGFSKSRSALRDSRKDKSPLRDLYFSTNDKILHILILNYLKACEEVFWKDAKYDSFIFKTIGVQALFDVLKTFAKPAYEGKDVSFNYFFKLLSPAKDIDFSGPEFRNASGSGRTAIRKAIESCLSVSPGADQISLID